MDDRFQGKTLDDALSALLFHLHNIRNGYDAKPHDGVLASVVLVGEFVDHLAKLSLGGMPRPRRDLADPLFHLGIALEGLRDGVCDPLLSPNPAATRIVVDEADDKVRGKGAGVGYMVWVGRATAAAAVQQCMDAGMSLSDASRYVADRIKHTTVMQGGRGDPRMRPKNWRDQLLAEEVKVGRADVPVDAPPIRRAAGDYNDMVRQMSGIFVSYGPDRDTRLRRLDAFLARTSTLRPALLKSEIQPGFPDGD